MTSIADFIDTLNDDNIASILNVIMAESIKKEVQSFNATTSEEEYDSYKTLIKKMIKKQPIETIIRLSLSNGNFDVFKYVERKDFPHNILECASNRAAMYYLLENIVDLTEELSIPNEDWVLEFIMTKTLKTKINPNKRIGSCPFWHNFSLGALVKFKVLDPLNKSDNFTEPIDINIQGFHGNTILHYAKDLPEEFLTKMKPRYDIKNDFGLCALEHRQKTSKSWNNLDRYIRAQDPNPTQMLSEQDSQIKELEAKLLSSNSLLISSNKLLEKYEAQIIKLRNIVSSNSSYSQ